VPLEEERLSEAIVFVYRLEIRFRVDAGGYDFFRSREGTEQRGLDKTFWWCEKKEKNVGLSIVCNEVTLNMGMKSPD